MNMLTDPKSLLIGQGEISWRRDEDCEAVEVCVDGESFDEVGVRVQHDAQPHVDAGLTRRLAGFRIPSRDVAVGERLSFLESLKLGN